MQMVHATQKLPTPVVSVRTPITDLLDVMADLSDVLESENDLLRRGLPAALSDMTERKSELADEYTDLTREVLSQCGDQIAGDPALHQRLLQAGQDLRALTQENMERLEQALEATRRRIEAVMAAIRIHDGGGRTYGASGQAIISRTVDFKGDFRS
jgi:flagellar biosynthesis/type III secretory pathway chaperone